MSEDQQDKRTSIGAGIAWAGLWMALGIYFSVVEIAKVL